MSKKTLKNKKSPMFVFGYGSLVNDSSRKRTLKSNRKGYPAIISKKFGYKKKFNTVASTENHIVMGIEPNKRKTTYIRGVIFKVNKKQRNNLKKREFVYTPINIPKKYINTKYNLPNKAKVMTFKTKYILNKKSKTKKIHKSYANIIKNGMKKLFGKKTYY